jgi:hypothetical protein
VKLQSSKRARFIHEPLGAAGLLVALLALVFAMAGGAWAAKKYVITSKNQIKPSVLKSLQGSPGLTGAAGANGANGNDGGSGANGTNGTNGTNGAPGSPWTAGGTLPSNATETGVWTFGPFADVSVYPGENKSVQTPVNFPIPLTSELPASSVHLILKNGEEFNSAFEEVPPAECLGTVAAPSAEPGNLCIYAGTELFAPSNLTGKVLLSPEGGAYIDPATGNPGVGVTGTILEIFAREEDGAKAFGAWAVTAE